LVFISVSSSVFVATNKVSVIIVCYNVEPYLRRCLDSVMAQSLEDMEVLVVVTPSPDGTENIARSYESSHPGKVRVIISEGKGLGMARNMGLDHASGDFIGFVDSDDWIERDMFQRMHDSAVSEGADLTICDYWCDVQVPSDVPTTRKILSLASSLARKRLVYHGLTDHGYGDTRSNAIMSGTTAVWNKLFSRNLLKGKGFYPDIVPEDYGLTISCICDAKRIVSVRAPLYHYQIREDSTLGDMRFFKQDPYQLFSSIARARDNVLNGHTDILPAFDDRATLGLFNWNIDHIHHISDKGARREKAERWARLLNDTLPGWRDRQPVRDWSVGLTSLEHLADCYEQERFDESYDDLIDKVTSPPYALVISLLRSLRKLSKI